MRVSAKREYSLMRGVRLGELSFLECPLKREQDDHVKGLSA